MYVLRVISIALDYEFDEFINPGFYKKSKFTIHWLSSSLSAASDTAFTCRLEILIGVHNAFKENIPCVWLCKKRVHCYSCSESIVSCSPNPANTIAVASLFSLRSYLLTALALLMCLFSVPKPLPLHTFPFARHQASSNNVHFLCPPANWNTLEVHKVW